MKAIIVGLLYITALFYCAMFLFLCYAVLILKRPLKEANETFWKACYGGE